MLVTVVKRLVASKYLQFTKNQQHQKQVANKNVKPNFWFSSFYVPTKSITNVKTS